MCVEVEIGVNLDLIALVQAYRIITANILCNSLPDFSVRLNLFVTGTPVHNLGFTSVLSINCDDHFETAVVKMSSCGMSIFAI
jgi:hypothetical protein